MKLSELSTQTYQLRATHAASLSLTQTVSREACAAHTLAFVTEGGAELVTAGASLALSQGSVSLLPPATPFSLSPVLPSTLILVTVELCDGQGAALSLSDAPVSFSADADCIATAERLLALYRTCADRTMLSGTAMQLLGVLSYRCAASELGAIFPAVAYIHTHLDTDLRVDALAALVGMCESTLRREFASRLGRSPKAYVLECKLERAADMLRSGLYSIKEICSLLGFWDDAYFSKLFKRHFGMTPMQYARECADA